MISIRICIFKKLVSTYPPPWASLVAQMVKRLPTMRETQIQSLGREAPLEKETATHSSLHAWKIPWTKEPVRVQSMGSQSWTRLSDFTSLQEACKVSGYIENHWKNKMWCLLLTDVQLLLGIRHAHKIVLVRGSCKCHIRGCDFYLRFYDLAITSTGIARGFRRKWREE